MTTKLPTDFTWREIAEFIEDGTDPETVYAEMLQGRTLSWPAQCALMRSFIDALKASA